MSQIFLGLGSNLRERDSNLRIAIDRLSKLSSTEIFSTSSIYETEPLYNHDQPVFLNQVIEINTTLTPDILLGHCKSIEVNMGRNIRNSHNQPRMIDIDILHYENMQMETETLVLPHPRISERKFVLVPWSELAEDFILPGMNQSIISLLNTTSDTSKIIKWNPEKVYSI